MAFTSTLLPLAAVSNGHYAASSADTSDSGGDTSVSGRSSRPGLRTVSLCRRHRHQPCLGFSLRGGREHGTGFFVSAVEKGSEAHLQGLMVGDQIIRVNGLPVEDATHREVLNLIQTQNTVTFKVRSVGMIPVKDSYNDSLTWRLVEPEPGGAPEPPDITSSSGFPNVHLYINVAPKAKLGCGICKGPEWKPGIFVQFTKENSLARNAGLRPGDQIIQCNNVVFTPDTPFTEAVSVLRSTGVLELVIQKGAGVDLFPGESSGYNSSASSVAGDQSPETWPHKRLSIVKEESVIDSDSRLTCSELNRPGGGERYKDSDRMVPSGHHPVKPQTSDGACTVIRVGPDMETYQDNELNPCSKLAEICMVSQQLETKTTTVLVEVHQSEDEETVHNQSDSSLCQLTNSSSVSSFSSSGANSLCSAISQELQRRSEKRAKEVNGEVKPKVELHKCGMDKEKVEQHQQLMEEFRRAHKKMFAHTLNDDNKTDPARPCPLASQSKEERESFRLKRQQKQEQHAANMSQERVLVAVKERDIRLERDKQDMTEAERELTRLVRRQQSSIPPPPPLPLAGAGLNSLPTGVNNNFTPLDSNLPPLPPFPPDCPTPDYDKESLSSEPSIKNNNTKGSSTASHSVNGSTKNGNADFVEMQSIESFKLTNPSVLRPKPPPIYFQPNMNGSTTTSSASKVSSDSKPNITIREYPKNTDVKNPERFQFLSQNGSHHTTLSSDEPLVTRLQDELSQTLSKANLRQDSPPDEKTVPSRMTGKNTVTISINALPNPLQKQESQHGKQAPFYLHKNENSYSNKNNVNSSRETPRKISTTLISQTYTNGNAVKSEDFTSKNCVSFNLSQPKDRPESRVVTVVQPNGILKNGLGGNIAQVQIHASQAQKSPSKSIKFAGITTAEVQEPKK
ncbi:uncharacterized protein LOC124362804 isoform X3 [Homalodisca vitripennis]|uniref:uncharacterized protein LOC124362804 isoform X3 n=1 Tax=Homalodisca vitripennis TaxID=197043 RepID=UPI001EEAE3FA|nr:uncharacterized protein LOC124362804 isoform X3 [Homalodisca vitripennis]